MLGGKVRIGIAGEVAEHRAVFHVVPVEDEIAVFIAPKVHKRHTALTVCAIKAPAQVPLGFLRREHDRIVDLGSGNTQPADAVRVLCKQLRQVTQLRCRFRAFLWGSGFFRHNCCRRLCGRWLYQGCESGKLIFFFLPGGKLAVDLPAGEQGKYSQQ